MDGTMVIDEGGLSEYVIRQWLPGDGVICSFASRASRNRPCGRPVAVRVSRVSTVGRARATKRVVVCAYHLSAWVRPCDLSTEAEKMAREKVIVEHWDEYQAAVREFMQPKVDEMISDLPDELKTLVLEALAREDDREVEAS